MQFSATWQKVLSGEKTQTRRIWRRGDELHGEPEFGYVTRRTKNGRQLVMWQTDNTYAVQPGRVKKAIARIRLKRVWCERLHEITDKEARAEGFENVAAFKEAWDKLHPHVGERWQDNPRVWVLEFELHSVYSAQVARYALKNECEEGEK